MLKRIREDPEHWRERAEEVRAVAELLSDPLAREMMLRIAAEYDLLGEHAARKLHSGAPKDFAGRKLIVR
jgi:hypothetical protein